MRCTFPNAKNPFLFFSSSVVGVRFKGSHFVASIVPLFSVRRSFHEIEGAAFLAVFSEDSPSACLRRLFQVHCQWFSFSSSGFLGFFS